MSLSEEISAPAHTVCLVDSESFCPASRQAKEKRSKLDISFKLGLEGTKGLFSEESHWSIGRITEQCGNHMDSVCSAAM